MTLATLLFHAALSTSILTQETPTGGEPYTLPHTTALILVIVLVAVLVLALAINARLYQPPPVSHRGEEDGGHGLEHG